MKILNKLMLTAAAMIVAAACNDGIDPIKPMPQGTDETAPQITLEFPMEGTEIKVKELVTNLAIDLEVTDDIEVKTIVLSMDGQQFATLDSFKDYRRVLIDDFMYEGLANGMHTLTVTATDIDNKTTTATATFEKAPPYIPIY